MKRELYYCDRCKREVEQNYLTLLGLPVPRGHLSRVDVWVTDPSPTELCVDCVQQYRAWYLNQPLTKLQEER